jgi:hypothetical protein
LAHILGQVVTLGVGGMKDVGAVVWYFSEQAWGADKENKVKAFLDQATKDGNMLLKFS